MDIDRHFWQGDLTGEFKVTDKVKIIDTIMLADELNFSHVWPEYDLELEILGNQGLN